MLGGVGKSARLAGRALGFADEAVNVTRSVSKLDNVVYRSVDETDRVNYIGITNNLERRAGEHLLSKGIEITKIPGLENLSRSDARAVEQVLIEFYGLSKDGGTLMNRINSIAKKNPKYAEALTRGRELLDEAGYLIEQ